MDVRAVLGCFTPRGSSMNTTRFRSEFGGLWTDRSDAPSLLKTLGASFGDEITMHLENWIEHGFVIIEGAVPQNVCHELGEEIRRIFELGSDIHIAQSPTEGGVGRGNVKPGTVPDQMRVVDMYAHSKLARDVLLAPRISRFLEAIFQERPLLFQGLTFEKGSQQGLHQDTAYVVVDRPMELAAAWVALEDIKEGSGELMYLDGSHRMPEWKFGGSSKHFDPSRHSSVEHDDWAMHLIRRGEELGMTKKLFRPKCGDVLIWSADLVHGGSPQEDMALTRRSIVGHYCPFSANPHYFEYMTNRIKVPLENGFMSSAYFDLEATSTPAAVRRRRSRRRT